MSVGKIQLFDKVTALFIAEFDIIGTFNVEENLNETPSNMKVKVITTNTYREEFPINTIVYTPLNDDISSWWVIKSDESTYLHTGEYEHEIQLVELLEFYSYRHLPNCAFAPNTYTLDQMLLRLFKIAKIENPDVFMVYPNFVDKDKLMPFMSFENYTVANAIKHIARTINAIPKMYSEVEPELGGIALTFINRNGLPNAIVENLNTQFPVAYEKNTNSSDQFVTRSVSNIANAKSSSLVIAPLSGGFKNITPNSITYVEANAKVLLPSKIDKIDFVRIYPPMRLVWISSTSTVVELYRGHYIDREVWRQALINSTGTGYSTALKTTLADLMPEVYPFQQVNYDDPINETYDPLDTDNGRANLFHNKMTILNKFEFDTESDTDVKNRAIHWTPFTNEMIMPLSFRNGLEGLSDHNDEYLLYEPVPFGNERLYIAPITRSAGFFSAKVPNDEVLIQVGYYPVADIKVTIDNDSDSNDEKFFNQSGKLIDAISVSKLITSHTNDSVEGTKIRNAKYTSIGSILPVGQIVRDSNQLYVISQRSIDAQIKNGNEYYNVLYTLSRNRVARSENIIADNAVISYKIPDDNLVFRTQIYKDYIELSLRNGNHDTPYLSMSKALRLEQYFNGTSFDYTVVAENQYGVSSLRRYVQNPSVFDLHRAKLMNVNWQDNNVLGYSLDSTGSTYVQTPRLYTDNLGKATNFELYFLDTNNLIEAQEHYNDNFATDPIVPFGDLTDVDNDFYSESVIAEGNYSIKIDEPDYEKDPYEIPVFEYMLQANDDYDSRGNTIVGNDIFNVFAPTAEQIRYHYVLLGEESSNPAIRVTPENAIKLFDTYPPSTTQRNRITIVRNSATQFTMTLYDNATFNTLNETKFAHIGIYAVTSTTKKFLFAINDYSMASENEIVMYINNWKI